MDSFEINKLVAAVLLAGLIAMTLGIFSRALVHPEVPETLAYAVQVPEGSETEKAPAEKPTGPEPIAPLLAAASAEAGQKETRPCQACHSFEQGGPNKVGPDLWGVVGRPIASHEGFTYSAALQEKGGEWSYDNLNHFLYDPKAWAPGTKMNFAGIKKTQDRADLIAYLRSLSATPAPLPE